MINTESLLKLLRDLLGCGVNNVTNVHGSCRVSFITQCDKKLEQYGMVIESPTDEQSSTDSQNLTTEMSTEKKRHSE